VPNPCFANMPTGDQYEHDCRGVAIDATCQVRCSEANLFKGMPVTLRCQSNGSFEGTLPTCMAFTTAVTTTAIVTVPHATKLSGSIMMTVSNRTLFISDANVKEVIRQIIADIANVTTEQVRVDVTMGRRLAERRLQERGPVQVDYSIILLSSNSTNKFEQVKAVLMDLSRNLHEASAKFNTAANNSGSSESFLIQVTDIAEPVFTIVPSSSTITTTAIDLSTSDSPTPQLSDSPEGSIATGVIFVLVILCLLFFVGVAILITVYMRYNRQGGEFSKNNGSYNMKDPLASNFNMDPEAPKEECTMDARTPSQVHVNLPPANAVEDARGGERDEIFAI